MSIQLDPLVSKKLQQFRSRRLWLIVLRAVSAGVLTFLIAMAVVAAIDWYWLLADSTRWYLSGTAYVAAAVATWLGGMGRLTKRHAREEIAAQMELTEPELRENLLSAVELATDDPAAIHDSPVFRGLLQGKVAQQMAKVQVPNLLPFRLIAKWVVAAVVVIGLITWLLSAGDARIRQLAARALLPGANIARVSRINVEVLQPTPHSLMLAEDETIAVVVDVTGGSVGEVTLETTTSQGTVRNTMRPNTATEYATNIHVGEESIEYRIFAGDAITQRYRIETRPRPHVLAFHKTFAYPEYARLPEETVTETHGDLLVLEGTQARLTLELDQAVSTAELRIDPADSEEVTAIPLAPIPSDAKASTIQWQAQVPVDAAGIYKVHLVSKETGFENIFSPKYEIRPIPDLIPKAGFVDQQEPTLLLPPNDILALQGMAEDDLPVERLEQQISVNGQDWLSVSLDAKPSDETAGRHVSAAWDWDLLGYKLRTGDQVLTKLVATDRKGNIGESVPLRIVVAAPDFDPERHTLMERKVSLYDELAAFSILLEEQKTLAFEAVDRMKQSERTAEQAAADRAILIDLAQKQRERSGELVARIKEVERDMPAGADAYDLDLTGRVIARIEREHSNTPVFLLAAMQHAEGDDRNKDLDGVKKSFDRSSDDAKSVAKHYQVLMSHNFLAGVAADMSALLQQQEQVVNSPTQTWNRLLRQETLVINQLRALENAVQRQRGRLPNGIADHMKQLLAWSEQQRLRLQDATESEEKLNELKNVSQSLLRELNDRQRYDVVDGNLPAQIVNIRKDFINRCGTLYVPIDQAGQTIRQENRLATLATASPDSTESQKLMAKAERFVAEVDLQHRHSVDQLNSRRELTQNRKDPDAQYAADAGLTHRAVNAILGQHREVDPQESKVPDQLLEVAPAYRILEAGHELIIARDALNTLLNLERWGSQAFEAHIEQPRQWDVVHQSMELASERLQQAGVKRELVDQLNQVRWSEPVREVGRKIGERRWRREAMVSAGHELVELRENLAAVVTESEPVMAEARAIIAKYAPTIPEMARQTAERLRELEQQTNETADAAEQPETQEAQQQLAELRQEQEAVNQQLDDLFQALVEDANAQDLLDEQQRERARDADDAIAMIQEPAEQMNRELEQAEQQTSGQQQAQELAQAAEQQEKTAQALELVAEHFERLNEGLDVAQTREELRQAEQELGIARQMDQRFENSEQLADMANQESQQLLSQLEEELQRNPAMQQALSEIAENALQEARNSLEYAAQDEQEVQRANERADAEFQAKKREVAEEVRQLGQEAARLARELVAQANNAAANGKSPEAQQKLAEAQQQLNQAANQANQANENQLLNELAQTTQETQAALKQAQETLQQARQQTNAGKDQQIHADEKARENQQKAWEKSRQQFQEQQRRGVEQLKKQAEDAKRRADQNVNNEQKQVEDAQRRVQQAQDQLNQKPDDQGRQNNLQNEQNRLFQEQQQLAQAQRGQQRADQDVREAQQQLDQVNSRPMPPLNAANPATQLADQYTGEAQQRAEQLRQQAEQLAQQTNFGNELRPPQQQLASANERQGQVTEDVEQAAQDVARAARHERRLNNMATSQPLQQAAEAIEGVAENQSANAEQQLQEAVTEAQPTAQNMAQNQQRANGETLQAQQAVASTQQAIQQQAEALTGVLEPLLAANAENAAQEAGEGDPGQPAGQPQAGSEPQAGSQPPQGNGDAPMPLPGNQPAQPQFTPEERARGQQLAQTLDELDRQAAQAAAQAAQPAQEGQPAGTPPTPARLDTLAQAARNQQAAAASARAQAQQQASESMAQANESEGEPPLTGETQEFEVASVNRAENANWGKLRSKSAEDLTNGRREAISEEYRKSVEAYFKVLAERAKKK